MSDLLVNLQFLYGPAMILLLIAGVALYRNTRRPAAALLAAGALLSGIAEVVSLVALLFAVHYDRDIGIVSSPWRTILIDLGMALAPIGLLTFSCGFALFVLRPKAGYGS